jgi:PAS domain S-box-containing protein
MLALLDKNFVYLAANEKYLEPFGLTRSKLIGSTVSDVFGDTYFETVIRPHAEKCLQGNRVSFSDRFDFPAFGERYMEIRYDPFLSPDNEIVGFVVNGRDITDRMHAEEALRESEERFRDLAELLPEAVFETDRKLKLTFANQRALELFGYSDEDLKRGLNGLEMLAPEYRDQAKETLARQSMGEDSGTVEYRAVRRDGTTFPMLFHASAIMQEGELFGLRGIIVDITERKRVEEEIERVSGQLQMSISKMPIAYILWNKNKTTLEWNKAAEEIFGYTREDMLGNSLFDAIVPRNVLHLVDQVADDLFAGKSSTYSAKYNNIRKDGQLISCRWDNTPISDSGGQVTSILSMAQDISESLQAENALGESEERLSLIYDTVGNVIFHLKVESDECYRFISVNKAFVDTTGLTQDMVVDKLTKDVIPEPSHSLALRKYKQAIEDHKTVIWEETSTYPTGKRTGIISIAPAYGEDGKCTDLIGSVHDITETKRLQELELRAERLETAGTIAGQVAHDFNNLLAPLMAYPEIIRDELPQNHPTLKYLDRIEKAALAIAEINQDLLAMGRRGHYNQKVLNLNTVVQHVLTELDPYPKTLVCKTDLSDDLMDIWGGGAQLHRVISNLLHNAKDAMQDIGQITVRTENYYVDDVSVVYGLVPKGEYVKLTISDTGCGIHNDIVQKIFDPFFSSKTTDKKRGSGLGLSVVDAVIKDHNGYVDLNTKVGEGTSFYIYFPVTRVSMDSQDADETCGGNETILVVDDDDVQREVSSQLLSKLGYEVSTVESGEKAIELLQEKPHDLVILDMIMPGGIDGTETYQQFLKINPHQKAIIVSGFSESDRVKEAQESGAGAFVKKPLTKTAVAVAVRTELDRKEKLSPLDRI